MVKLLGALLVMAAATAFGFFYAGRLRLRSDCLAALLTLTDSLKTEIRYSRDDIMTVLRRSLPNLLAGSFPNTDNADEFRKSLSESLAKSFALSRGEAELTRELFSKLGTTDVEGQLSHLELFGEKIRICYDNSLSEIKTKSKLYRLLGFLAGAAAAVTVL